MLDLDRLTGRERRGEGRRGLDLAGVDVTSRRTRAQRGGDPAAEASASERDKDGVGLREIFEDLEPDRPVPCHHGRVAESVDEEAVHPRVRTRAEDLEP